MSADGLRTFTMQAEISNIQIKLNGRVIDLTADEARTLHAELDKLFSSAKLFVPVPVTVPVYSPPQPIIIERDRTTWPPYWWEVTCETPGWSSTGCSGSAPGTLCMDLQ